MVVLYLILVIRSATTIVCPNVGSSSTAARFGRVYDGYGPSIGLNNSCGFTCPNCFTVNNNSFGSYVNGISNGSFGSTTIVNILHNNIQALRLL